MAESAMVVIAFRSEFLSLQDAEGKVLTTDAVLFLSQVVWLSENKADADGWFEWATETCTKQTGLSRRQQDVVRKQLSNYLQRDRRGVNGGIVYRLCRNPLHAEEQPVAHRSATETKMRRVAHRGATEAGRLHTEEQPVAHRGATETPAVSTQDTKTLRETLPPISPQEGEVRPKRVVFVPPSPEEVVGYMTEIGIPHLAAQWMAHYQANGWKVGRNPMKDWRAACRTWRETEKNSVRGSPRVAKNGHVSRDMSLWETAEEIGRAFEEL